MKRRIIILLLAGLTQATGSEVVKSAITPESMGHILGDQVTHQDAATLDLRLLSGEELRLNQSYSKVVRALKEANGRLMLNVSREPGEDKYNATLVVLPLITKFWAYLYSIGVGNELYGSRFTQKDTHLYKKFIYELQLYYTPTVWNSLGYGADMTRIPLHEMPQVAKHICTQLGGNIDLNFISFERGRAHLKLNNTMEMNYIRPTPARENDPIFTILRANGCKFRRGRGRVQGNESILGAIEIMQCIGNIPAAACGDVASLAIQELMVSLGIQVNPDAIITSFLEALDR